MTRLLTTGWETGDIAEDRGTGLGTGTQVVVASTPSPRSPGSYCLRFGNAANSAYRQWLLPATKTDVWIRCAVWAHSTTNEWAFITVYDGAGTPAVQGTLSWTATDRLLRVYRGTYSSGTLLGTSVAQYPPDEWHTIDLRWQITSTTVGIVEVWVDDTQWLNLTAIDNTQTTTANVRTIMLGSLLQAWTASVYVAYDDFAINDTAGSINTGRIGDGRVVLLKPNGAGSNTGLTRGGTDTGANWSQTSELPPSMTQYVLGATAALRDTYALEDVPAGSWTVNACEVLAYAQNSDAGAGSLGLTVKSGGTTNEATAQALTTTAAYYRQLYELDPDTSAAWTVAAVTALEAGVTVR